MQRRTRPKVRKFSDDSVSENDQELVIGAAGRDAIIGVTRDAKMTAPTAKRFEQDDDQ